MKVRSTCKDEEKFGRAPRGDGCKNSEKTGYEEEKKVFDQPKALQESFSDDEVIKNYYGIRAQGAQVK